MPSPPQPAVPAARRIGADSPCRTRQHDAWPIIARKHQRPFQRAGRQHHPRRRAPATAVPAAAARSGSGRWSVSRSTRPTILSRIPAECRRARQQRHRGHASAASVVASQSCAGHHRSLPRLGQQRTADLRLLIAHDHPRARAEAANAAPRPAGPAPTTSTSQCA